MSKRLKAQLKEVMKLYTAEKLLRDELDTEVIRLDDLNRSRLDTCQEVIEERDVLKTANIILRQDISKLENKIFEYHTEAEAKVEKLEAENAKLRKQLDDVGLGRWA